MNPKRPYKSFTSSIASRPFGDVAFAICTMLLIAGAVGGVAIGCGWSFLNEHSARFAGYNSAGEFTRLPPLPIRLGARRKNPTLIRDNDLAAEYEYEAARQREKGLDELWDQADAAE